MSRSSQETVTAFPGVRVRDWGYILVQFAIVSGRKDVDMWTVPGLAQEVEYLLMKRPFRLDYLTLSGQLVRNYIQMAWYVSGPEDYMSQTAPGQKAPEKGTK